MLLLAQVALLLDLQYLHALVRTAYAITARTTNLWIVVVYGARMPLRGGSGTRDRGDGGASES